MAAWLPLALAAPALSTVVNFIDKPIVAGVMFVGLWLVIE